MQHPIGGKLTCASSTVTLCTLSWTWAVHGESVIGFEEHQKLTPPCVGVFEGERMICGNHVQVMASEDREVCIRACSCHHACTNAIRTGHSSCIRYGSTLLTRIGKIKLEVKVSNAESRWCAPICVKATARLVVTACIVQCWQGERTRAFFPSTTSTVTSPTSKSVGLHQEHKV